MGIDGGRRDGRDFLMTRDEYVVRVTHERLHQRYVRHHTAPPYCCCRWYAGASVEFETNKGRVMSFHPYLATRQRDQEVTIRATPGHEIIMLKIK